MLIPNRHESSDKYRYGFNGMEADDELKGSKNSYDFGARMYDPRVGRWLSLDPRFDSYPAVTPYVFALNSPLLFKDPDGKDAIVTVQKDPNGGGKILIKSTVYITGNGTSSARATDLTNQAGLFLRDGKYVDDKGKIWKISFDVKFEYVEDKSAIKLAKGENILDFSDENVRSHINAKITTTSKGGIVTKIEKTAGIDGIIGNRGNDEIDEMRENDTVIHETLHLLGLSDRYSDKTNAKGEVYSEAFTNFEKDIMGSSQNSHLSQTHFDNFGKAFSNKKDGDYLLNKKIDINTKGKLIGKGYRPFQAPIITKPIGIDNSAFHLSMPDLKKIKN